MDSGNNSGGSMQSSSGGDEEYDSRPDSISPFFNSTPPTHFGSASSNPIHQPNSLHHHLPHQPHQPNLFDLQSHNLAPFSQPPANPNPNSLYNLDSIWSRAPRPDPSHTQFGTPIASSSSSSSQALLGLSQGPFTGPFQGPAAINADQPGSAKPSKKRTRASRRAPTTVLTTDMSNFRQMVQEFTGIPAAPFSASPYSRRLDLFGSGSNMRSGPLETLGPLFRAATVQKVQPSAFLSSSSSSLFNSTINDSIAPTTTNINSFNPSSNSYHIPVTKQPPSMTTGNMENPLMTFQSLLQFPFPPQVSQGSHSMDELGMSHDHQNVNSRLDKGYLSHHGNVPDGTQMFGRPKNGGGGGDHRENSGHVGNFHQEKGLDNVNVPSRGGEGTVDSWICPSE